MSVEHEVISVRPFIDDLEINTNRKDIFMFGSTKLSEIVTQKNWLHGSLLNDNHDYEVYSKYWNDELLNYDSIICDLEMIEEMSLPKRFFVRPTLGNKTFIGQVMYSYELIELLQHRRLNA
jgi:hypothetical protein